MSPQLREGALGFEDIATIPKPGQQGLSQVAFSPDGRHVTYLGGDPASLTRQLFAFDCETGKTQIVLGGGVGDEAKLSKEEQLQRERARIMSTGVTSYAWAAEANRLLVPLDGALWVLDGVGEGAPPPFRPGRRAVGRGRRRAAARRQDQRGWRAGLLLCGASRGRGGRRVAAPAHVGRARRGQDQRAGRLLCAGRDGPLRRLLALAGRGGRRLRGGRGAAHPQLPHRAARGVAARRGGVPLPLRRRRQ